MRQLYCCSPTSSLACSPAECVNMDRNAIRTPTSAHLLSWLHSSSTLAMQPRYCAIALTRQTVQSSSASAPRCSLPSYPMLGQSLQMPQTSQRSGHNCQDP